MKSLGKILFFVAVIALAFAVFNSFPDEVEAADKKYVKEAESMGFLDEGQLEKSQNDLKDLTSQREKVQYTSFAIAGLAFLCGIICVASRPSSPRPIATANPPPLGFSKENPQSRQKIPPPPPAHTLRIAQNGVDLGDIPLEKVREKLISNDLSPEDHYWNSEQGEWVKLQRHPAFYN